MQNTIEECRRLFGPAPRRFKWLEKRYLEPRVPIWMYLAPKDALWNIMAERPRLLREGRVVWGCLVQANTHLFEPGRADLPAGVVFSEEDYFDENLDELQSIAENAYRLKNDPQVEGSLAKFAGNISDELSRPLRLQVPPELCDNHAVYMSVIIVWRKHLPGAVLTDRCFPLIVHPELQTTIILPERFWPAPLLAAWRPPA
jgi:hypothetical protein